MARKKPADAEPGAAVAATGPPEVTAPPAYAVGPIPTAKAEAVAVAVWGRQVAVDGQEVTVYAVTAACRHLVDGQWRAGRTIKGSQIYALVYCLEKASAWILAQRDPANAPF